MITGNIYVDLSKATIYFADTEYTGIKIEIIILTLLYFDSRYKRKYSKPNCSKRS
jgi:hypothetical protein